MTESYIHRMSIYGINNLVLVAMVTALPRWQKFSQVMFCSVHHQPNLSFTISMIRELSIIILSKCRQYSPEPRFQTKDPET